MVAYAMWVPTVYGYRRRMSSVVGTRIVILRVKNHYSAKNGFIPLLEASSPQMLFVFKASPVLPL